MKERNLKIGEVEGGSNISTGYIARIKNDEDKGNKIPINILCSLANYFNLSLDTLCFIDLKSVTKNEALLLDFVIKLIDDTDEDRITWEKHYIKDIDFIDSILSKSFNVSYEMQGDYPLVNCVNANNESVCFYKDVFILNLNNNKTLFLFNVYYGDVIDDMKDEYELYIYDKNNNTYKNILSTFNLDNESIIKYLELLFLRVLKKEKEPKIDDDVFMTITDYMKK